ncbi:MAG: acetolactate synthase large subunit [Alphaproteobacteria bacterium]
MKKKTTKASDLFVKALENENVEYVFGVPGEENLDFLESLRKSKKIKLILTRHEQGAAFMAATYGRLTGKAGVCLSTLGPGATNLVTGAAYATLGAMPMLMITGQKPIKKSKQGRFQILNIVDMMRPLTKFTHQIVNGNTIPSLVREAFRVAEEERPGAVHLELPEDIAKEETTEPIFRVGNCRRPNPDEKSVERAIEMIQKAKHPLLLVGAEANRNIVCQALIRFVEKTGVPFFNTQMGKGVMDERRELFLGTAALSEGDYLHCAIDKADLIINVGHDVVEKPPFLMHHGGKKVIHINFQSASVDSIYFPHLEVVGDIASAVDAITTKIEKNPAHDFSYFMKIRDEILTHIAEKNDDSSYPLVPQRIVADVRKVMPSLGIVALDNGVYKLWFARNYMAHRSNTILLDNALATMGAGLPSAMMASMIFPDRRVMAVCGDGGFMMNSQELETAVRLNLNLVVIILNDNAYGMIKWKQEAEGFENFGLDYGNPDFVKYAESYGAAGHRVEDADAFLPLMEDCFQKGGVHLIEVPIDYSENIKVLTDGLKERSCKI